MKKNVFFLLLLSATLVAAYFTAKADTRSATSVFNDSSRLKLPSGFSSTIICEGLGGARHIAVTKTGGIYVKLSRLKDGKGIYYLRDTNNDGIMDEQKGFGDYPGTGIVLKDGYLYASSNEDVYRYKLNENEEVINPDAPEKIIIGLVNRNRDNSKSIALDNAGSIYVNVGSYVNACLLQPNTTKAPMPCPLLDSAGGIWKFKRDKLGQTYSDGIHYATGLKNVVGLDWNAQKKALFVMQHGRDQLHELFPQYYTEQQSNELPAETMYEVHQGSDGGWPYVYYHPTSHKKILAPEYGGNGIITGGEKAQDPVMAFPAHLAPNGLLFYTGNGFPPKYKNGAFIAFHGLSPQLQKGYLVAFVPFKKGKPSGQWEIFADNFSGKENYAAPGKIEHRPCGLAQGPDGSIYVTDDSNGAIFKISYNGK